MSEIAACTLIQEEPDRKTEGSVGGVEAWTAESDWEQNKIHSARVGRSYKIPKLCVVEYLLDQNRQLGGMRLSNSLAPSLQNTPESSKLMMPKQRTFGCEQKGA